MPLANFPRKPTLFVLVNGTLHKLGLARMGDALLGFRPEPQLTNQVCEFFSTSVVNDVLKTTRVKVAAFDAAGMVDHDLAQTLLTEMMDKVAPGTYLAKKKGRRAAAMLALLRAPSDISETAQTQPSFKFLPTR